MIGARKLAKFKRTSKVYILRNSSEEMRVFEEYSYSDLADTRYMRGRDSPGFYPMPDIRQNVPPRRRRHTIEDDR